MSELLTSSTILENARLITYKLPNRETVEIVVHFAVGSAHELESQAGIAHFVEHLAFQDQEHGVKSSYQDAFSAIGAMSNASTQNDQTLFRVKVLARYLNEALTILGAMLSQNSINPFVFETEKSIILEEYRNHRGSVMHESFLSCAFGDHPVTRAVIGDETTIKGLTPSDIIAFRNTHYVSGNLTVLLIGDIDHSDTSAHIENAFKNLEIGKQSAADPIEYFGGESHFPCKCENGEIFLGLPLELNNLADSAAAMLATQLIGAHPTSRLFKEIREKQGLAYDVNCWLEGYFGNSILAINADCHADNNIRVFELMCHELTKLRDTLTDEELDGAKQTLTCELLMTLDNSAELSREMIDGLGFLGECLSVRNVCDAINNIDAKAIRMALAGMLAATPSLAVHGRMRKMPTLAQYQALISSNVLTKAA